MRRHREETMNSVSPVFKQAEVENERVIALDQPEYYPIVVLPVVYSDGTEGVIVRFRLSDEDRQKVADGGDIVLSQLTFGNRFAPVNIGICGPNELPY